MSNMTDDDDQQRFALGLIFVLLGLLLTAVIGTVVVKQRTGAAANKGVSTVAAPAAAAGAASAGVALAQTAAVASNAAANGSGAAATAASAEQAEPVTLAPQAVVQTSKAAVRVDGDVVKFFFVTGQSDIAPEADQALVQILEGVKQGKRVQVSGFHDAVGNLEQNQALAKKRAQAVQETLQSLGVPAAVIELHKPEHTQADGNNAEARRVEVTLL